MTFPSIFGASAADNNDPAHYAGFPEVTDGWHLKDSDRREPPARYEAYITAVLPTASPSTSALLASGSFPLTPVHRWVAACVGAAVDFHAWLLATANPDMQVFHLAMHVSSTDDGDVRRSGDRHLAGFLRAVLDDLDVQAITASCAVTRHPGHGIDNCLVERIGTIESITAKSILAEVAGRVTERATARDRVAKVCAGGNVPDFERVHHLADITERIEVGDLLPALAPDRAELEEALTHARATAVACELMRVGEWDTSAPCAIAQRAYATHMATSAVVSHTRPDAGDVCPTRDFVFSELNVCGGCFWCILNEQPAGPLTAQTEARVLDELYNRDLEGRGSPEVITCTDGRFDTGGREYCTALSLKSLDQMARELDSAHATRDTRIERAIASAVAADRLTLNDLIHAEPLFEDLEHYAHLAHRHAQWTTAPRGE
jgi:hypothetical protein